jgi:polyisoprenoid-binding protein YceI
MRVNSILVAVALCSSALGQDLTYELDPAQTRVEFTLGDVLHTVHGNFKLKSGSIRFSPGSGSASGAIVIDAKSGNSGSDARDKRMHKNILESDRYPEITFTPDRVEGNVPPQGPFQVQVHGSFKIHGAEHELVLAIKGEAGQGHQMTTTTHFVVPYVSWGMKNPSTFILRVNDKVDIDIKAVIHAGVL